MEAEHGFAEVDLVKQGVKVSIEYIGEGYHGDYDPEDPDDKQLLRFSVYKWNAEPHICEWESVQDGSYCTYLPADLDVLDKAMVARIIMDEVFEPISKGTRPKRAMEHLSHLDENDIMRAWDGEKGN